MRTKIWGLKKLRTIQRIAEKKGVNLNAKVIPWKVYSHSSQFQPEHFLGQERVLIRSDLSKTKKRQTQEEWNRMKRDEADSENTKKIQKIIESNQRNLILKRKTRVIMHPTQKRKNIAYSCSVIYNGKGKLVIKVILMRTALKEQKMRERIHRVLPSVVFPLTFLENKINLEKSKLAQGKSEKEINELIKNAVNFLNIGINENQIKLKNKPFEISFVSFKGKETIPEFYDFLENFRYLNPFR